MSQRQPVVPFRVRYGKTAGAPPTRVASIPALLVLFACALAVANCGRTDLGLSEVAPGHASCQTSADCASTPATPVCDVPDGACVQCTTAAECPSGQACENFTCHCSSGAQCPGGFACCGALCVNELSDTGNCGVCDHGCLPNQACVGGSCTSNVCPNGLAMCGNACVDESSDPSHCGACGVVCSPAQKCAGGSCIGGPTGCRNTGCAPGLTCCGDACVDTKADLKNCGGCFAACPASATSCQLGGCCTGSRSGPSSCSGFGCPGGLTNCANVCVDESNDPSNCGGCRIACLPNQKCIGGACIGPPTSCKNTGCGRGLTCCGDTCVDTKADLKNCGGCFAACAPGATSCQSGGCCSSSGTCSGMVCGGGLTNCANVCVDESRDPSNCGGCRRQCPAGDACIGGVCTQQGCNGGPDCAPGLACCGAGCVDTSSDPRNCGSCNSACAAPPNGFATCSSGACSFACVGGLVRCVGSPGCVDVLSDPNNCGACNNPCRPGSLCRGGMCTRVGCQGGPSCAPGQACCATGCVSTGSDPRNCGSCNSACAAPPNAFATCSSGACSFACAPGFGDCDGDPSNGCEADLSTAGANCGKCGATCTSGSRCIGGSCTASCLCPAPQVCCDANGTICTDTTSDPAHCGACGVVCSAGTTCSGGVCMGPNEGAFDPIVNPTYLTPGVHNFTTINVPSGVVVYVAGAGSPSGTLDLRATGDIIVDGTIDVSGGPGSQSTVASQSTSAGRAGSGGNTGEIATAPPSTACGFIAGNGGRNGAGPAGTIGNCPSGPTTCDGAMPFLFAAPPARFGGGAGVFTGYRAYGAGGGGPAGGSPGALGAPFFGEADCSGVSGGGGATNGGGGKAGGTPYDGADGVLGQTQCLGQQGVQPAYVGGGGGGSIGVAAAKDLAVATTFQTGSGGGGGSADYLNRPVFGGTSGGGGGGGALRLSTPTNIAISGQLLARGGYGADAFIGNGQIANCDPQPGAAGGGGSGGVIYLQAPTIVVSGTATVSTDGGAGGSASEFATGGAGGAGGLGRIRLSVNPASCKLLGTFNPPLASGCAQTTPAVAGSAFVGVFPM